jgi:uncharacterized protein involved in tellurium resistance
MLTQKRAIHLKSSSIKGNLMSDLSEVESLLSNQGDSQNILFVNELTVTLSWHAQVDLDLMAFYKTQSGEVGGIYSSMYADGGQGDLHSFPHMRLSQDAGVGAGGGDEEKEETLQIKTLDEIAELYLVAMNFTDASRNRKSEFASFDGRVTVRNEEGKEITVVLSSKEQGPVAVFARIEQTNKLIGPVLHNESRVMTFEQFRQEIPGAADLSLANKLLLQGRGDSATLSTTEGQVSAQLMWSTSVDLDLHCFYQSREITVEQSGGGFLQSLFGGGGPKTYSPAEGHIYFGQLGSLSDPPYIELDQDSGVGDVGGDNEENMRIGDIAVIERALIAVNIYNKPNARFGTYDGRVILRAGEQEIVISLDTQETGAWCVIAEIDNRSGQPKVTNTSKVQKARPSLKSFKS